MKKIYEDSTLGVSLDSFPAPKKVGIPLDCDLLAKIRQGSSQDDAINLEDLGL